MCHKIHGYLTLLIYLFLPLFIYPYTSFSPTVSRLALHYFENIFHSCLCLHLLISYLLSPYLLIPLTMITASVARIVGGQWLSGWLFGGRLVGGRWI